MRPLFAFALPVLLAACSSPRTPERDAHAPTPPSTPPPTPVEIRPELPAPAPPVANDEPDLSPSKAPRRFQILNGRLSAILPAGARLDDGDVPAPPAGAATRQSRHVVDGAAMHVAIAAFELLAPAGADFEREVREGVLHWKRPPRGHRLEPVTAHAPLRVLQLVLAAPEPAGLSDEAGVLQLVTILYVAHPDGTAQAIELHVADVAQAAAVVALARTIGESLEVGPLGLPHVAGERVVPFGTWRIVATVPDGFVAVVENGMDFTMGSIVALAPIATEGASLELFIGEGADPLPPGAAVPGRLFGEATQLRRTSSRGFRRLVGLVHPEGLTIAVTMSAKTERELEAVRDIAATMRLTESTSP